MKPICSSRDLSAIVVLFVFVTFSAIGQEHRPQVSFDQDIRPLLSDRCYACHGPDSSTREAGLRLDRQQESHGQAIEPGSLDGSELWHRITSDDDSDVMPPADSHKKRFSEAELTLIKKWIEQGAEYQQFWAFKPLKPSSSTGNNDPDYSSPIEKWVFDGLKQRKLKPAPEANSRILIRRASLDLNGLPPTPSQIREFMKWQSDIGHSAAWEKWIDQLLESPRYGEHMARYWLDLVRYADTNGMHKDFYRNHFAYRDWVIRAFNENLAYDKFLRDQLAGDLYDHPTQDQLTASAFNRLHMIIDRGTALPEESLHKNVIDRVTAASTAFLGLTMQCAQCHDHKFDPISQKEFYAFYGFFNNFDTAPETDSSPPNGLQPPYITLADDSQRQVLERFDEQLEILNTKIENSRKQLAAMEDQSSTPAVNLEQSLKQYVEQQKKIISKRSAYDRDVPYVMISRERDEIRQTFLLKRGDYDSPGEPVERGTPAFLPPLEFNGETPTRMDLANWFVSADHPLTARVAVNRIWQNLIGRGIVKTSEDFGAQGAVPTHPELLDHLASSFIESGWDTKQLIKSIVMSKTYRRSSTVSDSDFEADPDNRWLSRGNRFRLDAEVLRDQLLFTSGHLVERMHGRSVKPPQPDGLWASVTMTGERYVADEGPDTKRRSVYTFWKRAMPPPQLTILNAPMRDSCIARRERTNTAPQALLLLNEPTYVRAGRKLAIRTATMDPPQRINFVWETITGRAVDELEKKIVQSLVDKLILYYQSHPELAEAVCEGAENDSSLTDVQIAAWTSVVNTIYNLDITRSRD